MAKRDSSTQDGAKEEGSEKRRKKVSVACLYCRRSHMVCTYERPCTRCVKRGIGDMCTDEKPPARASSSSANPSAPSAKPPLPSPPTTSSSTSLPHPRSPSPSRNSPRSQNNSLVSPLPRKERSLVSPPPPPPPPSPLYRPTAAPRQAPAKILPQPVHHPFRFPNQAPHQPHPTHFNPSRPLPHTNPGPSTFEHQPVYAPQPHPSSLFAPSLPSSSHLYSSASLRPQALAPTPLQQTPVTSPRLGESSLGAHIDALGGTGGALAGGVDAQETLPNLTSQSFLGDSDWNCLSEYFDAMASNALPTLPHSPNQNHALSPAFANLFSTFPADSTTGLTAIHSPAESSTAAGGASMNLSARHAQIAAMLEQYRLRNPGSRGASRVPSRMASPKLDKGKGREVLPDGTNGIGQESAAARQPQLEGGFDFDLDQQLQPLPHDFLSFDPSSFFPSLSNNPSAESDPRPSISHDPNPAFPNQSPFPSQSNHQHQPDDLPPLSPPTNPTTYHPSHFAHTAAIPQLHPPPAQLPTSILHQILLAKFESSQLAQAGRGFDFKSGWAALDDWMERAEISEEGRRRIRAPVEGVFRPTVRRILEGMGMEERLMVEESFQRMLLQYERSFAVVKTPACVWRRTGQIFTANQEFANLLGIDPNFLKDGQVGIYELMDETSAVSFWEQYCQIGFDFTRKAVLTTSTLSTPAHLRLSSSSRRKAKAGREIQCCFSFTVIRDDWGIPLAVSGNFMDIA